MSENSGMTAGEFAMLRIIKGAQDAAAALGSEHHAGNCAEAFATAKALIAERDALRQEVGRVSDLLQGKFDKETLLSHLHVQGGSLEMEIQNGAAGALAEYFAALYREIGGSNYAEMTFTSKHGGASERYTVRVQRELGKTPHELRAEAEADRDRLAAEVLRLQDAVMESDARGAALMEERDAAVRDVERYRFLRDQSRGGSLCLDDDRPAVWLNADEPPNEWDARIDDVRAALSPATSTGSEVGK